MLFNIPTRKWTKPDIKNISANWSTFNGVECVLKTTKKWEAARISKKTAFSKKKHSFQLDLKKPSFYTWDFLRLKLISFCCNSLFVVFQIVHKNIKCCFFSSFRLAQRQQQKAFGMCRRSVWEVGTVDELRKIIDEETFDFCECFFFGVLRLSLGNMRFFFLITLLDCYEKLWELFIHFI